LRFAKLIDIAEKRGPGTIGEGGTGLSGGETLRLAIARIAAQPDVTLILADEPTAHLDAETAREVTDNLLALARGKTMVVATHDVALARRVGRIVRMTDRLMESAA
jgi:ATP-binding cassette subfamily C protein CydD